MLRTLLTDIFRSRADLIIENIALRQQLAVLQQRSPRPKISNGFRLFWVTLKRFWPKWKRALLVKPQTVVWWHRRGFSAYWRWRSRRKPPGRPRIDTELRALIRRIVADNPTRCAPRIHGELLRLGFDVSERTISRYLPHSPNPGAVQSWRRFLQLHREALTGMDFFTIPTFRFQVIYVLVIVGHHRRQILYWAVTQAPTIDWIRQQLRQAFPYDSAPRYLILDRDGLFCDAILRFLRDLGTTPKRTGARKPWQNGVCERWIGSVRRELLDHVVVLNDAHLRRLLGEYIAYYEQDQTHLSLGKDTPEGREIERRPGSEAEIISFPRVGGLHHRYSWRAAA